MEKELLSTERLSLLVIIVKKEKVDYFIDMIREYDSNLQFIIQGNGTSITPVGSTMYLDLTISRSIIFSILPEDKLKQVLSLVNEKFETFTDCKGIAYSIPISKIMGVNFYNLLSNNKDTFIK